MILDAEQHASAKRSSHSPHIFGVQHVPEVEPAGRRRRKAGQRRRSGEVSEALDELGEHAPILYNPRTMTPARRCQARGSLIPDP